MLAECFASPSRIGLTPFQGKSAPGEPRAGAENDESILKGKGMISHSDHSLLHRSNPSHPSPGFWQAEADDRNMQHVALSAAWSYIIMPMAGTVTMR